MIGGCYNCDGYGNAEVFVGNTSGIYLYRDLYNVEKQVYLWDGQ